MFFGKSFLLIKLCPLSIQYFFAVVGLVVKAGTCVKSIQRAASSIELNSTNAKPRDAPKFLNEKQIQNGF